MARRTFKSVLVVGLFSAMLLGGCVRFGSKPPASLLMIESTLRVEPSTDAQVTNGVVTIIEPDAPKALATVRVAVQTGSNSFAYVPKAYWVDTPRNLFRAVLAETVAARNSMLVLDSGQFSASPSKRLTGDLVSFGIDAQARQAVVTYDAVLLGKDGVTAKRRFTAKAPVSAINADTVAPAIGVASNAVAVQVADWLKTL